MSEEIKQKADVYDMLREDYGIKGSLAEFVDWQASEISKLQQRLDEVAAESKARGEVVGRLIGQYSAAGYHAVQNSLNPGQSLLYEAMQVMKSTNTDAILNSVRADAVRKVVHEADGYEKQFQRDLTPAEWRTLVVNYFGVFDGLSRPIDTAKGGSDDKR